MANTAPRVAPCGSWKSPITSDLISAQSVRLGEVCIDGREIYWVESRPQEGGRNVVCRSTSQGAALDVNPGPFDVRTRVYEYGGGAWTIVDGTLYFSHNGDARLYRLDRDASQPIALTPPGAWRYGDGIIDRRRARWIGVRETHSSNKEPIHTIVSVALDGASPHEGHTLLSGHDFYSSPRLSPNGKYLAWLEWDHPDMPWTSTTLCAAHLDENGVPGAPRIVAGGPGESVFQPEWSPDSSALIFMSDRSGWWNPFRYDLATNETRPLITLAAEFGQPQWMLGMSTYSFVDAQRIVFSYIARERVRLAVLDLVSGRFTELTTPYTDFWWLRASGDTVVFCAGSAQSSSRIVRLDLNSGKSEVLKKSSDIPDDPDMARYLTQPEFVEFPTEGGKTAFGFYYPPANPDYKSPEKERPPLLVKCHGGPTAEASRTLDLRTHFWTSRGIAVLDVNYGGSSGFGREYRERLNSNWGVVDVDDCVNGARFLASQGLVDPQRSVIAGGSAGGYTTLAALTFRDYFRGGASHFGISDLTAFSQETHKFEMHYLEWLLGPCPQQAAIYRERSPLYYAEKLSVPIIFFQGDEDAIVPPNQTEQMVDSLRRNGRTVGYLLFAGEQHGFRAAKTIRRVLDAELYFYSIEVFGVNLSF